MPAIPKALRAVSLAPLTNFYERAGVDFPEVTFIHGEHMPEPYRKLLVHHSDMTPQLAAFHESSITLDVLALDLDEPELTREVILRRADDQRPVEFGAITIYLDRLPDHIATPVREAKRPLGGILQAEKFQHLSAPRGYFRTKADPIMAELLGAKQEEVLYGRCNVLALQDGAVFAEIVEILPSVDSPSA